MFKKSFAALAVALLFAGAASAQNIAIVNGKPVPQSRADVLMQQATRGGQQPATPDIETRVKEEAVVREIFAQEAEKRGMNSNPEFLQQLELARQTLLIRTLFTDYQKKNPVTDAEAQAEYEKVKAQAATTGGDTEYRARHILVEKEDEANKLLAQIKRGTKFEELAKKSSKDTGSAKNGGDLDFAKPDAYVPEFSKAMVALKKGEVSAPVKSQFGYHIIKLEDTREAKFPEFAEVKPQVVQRLEQQKMTQFQESLRKAAKTDFKFTQQP
jgi:peptidyl-prolyl cis-trans isomerase C